MLEDLIVLFNYKDDVLKGILSSYFTKGRITIQK